jgi:imidazolonepropionase-like amidohydrolase
VFIIKNARIHTITNGEIENGMVVIEGGKISYVGDENAALLANRDAHVVDADRKLLTPGLIDAHTHLGIDEEGIGWEGADFNETSEAVTPHMRAIDGINPFEEGFIDAVKSGITTVQVLPGSANVIGGLTTTIKVKPGQAVDDIVIHEIAGLKIAFGENPKKLHGQKGRAPVTRMGVAALLREQFTKAINYERKRKVNPDDVDLRMEALCLALRREIPVRAHAHRADDILTAIRIAKEFNLDLSVEHTTEGHKIVDQLVRANVKLTVGPTLSSRSKVELRELDWNTYHLLAEKGLPFALITDHPVIPIGHILTSAALAVKHGLPVEKAWESITINAAKVLNIEHQVGSIEAGKDADLVLWDDNPITKHGKAVMTIIDGEIIEV